MDAYFSSAEISLFLRKLPLLLEKISLLIVVGNLTGNRCGTGVFHTGTASESPRITKFPVNFPDSREL
jgi:hypothetical protein